MNGEMADVSSLDEKGWGELRFICRGLICCLGGKECLGEAGVYCSAEAYYRFLSAVQRRDGRLFTRGKSFEELLKGQLDEEGEKWFNEYVGLDQAHVNTLGCKVPG